MKAVKVSKRQAASAKKPDRQKPKAKHNAASAADLTSEVDATLDQKFTIKVGNRAYPSRPKSMSGRVLNVHPDMPDVRDRPYQPHLRALAPAIYPKIAFKVRNQGKDSSCTGYSLAHVIDAIRFREVTADLPQSVSARMLYEMAKRNDEWDGTAYEGSSIRGAIKGFYCNGVCSEAKAPDQPGVKDWTLTYEMAKEARELRLGAYYRVQPDISDYHAALNEIGVIYASAQIHKNWFEPEGGKIVPGGDHAGGHAFAIVGYDDSGFWVLNSWGPEWGKDGIAHWEYGDWANTIMDAWVLQLGVRAPTAFAAVPRGALSSTSGFFGSDTPRRGDILGHFININDGRYVTEGSYNSPTENEIRQTVDRLTMAGANNGRGFPHLVLYAHGGLNSLEDEATRIAAWKKPDIFGRNSIYNFHLMWGSDLCGEIFGSMSKSPVAAKVGGSIMDWLFEAGPGKLAGSRSWRNMKRDALVAFSGAAGYDGGFIGLKPLLQGLDQAAIRPKIHLVCHSAGSIVMGHFLSALKRFKLSNIGISTMHLMAPACTTDFFAEHYGKFLADKDASKDLDKIYLYNLNDKLELDDTVSPSSLPVPSYSASLLYLVSRAYEEKPKTPLAGMERYAKQLPPDKRISIDYSTGVTGKITTSITHGGFDNDVTTLNTIMTRILGAAPAKPVRPEEVEGY